MSVREEIAKAATVDGLTKVSPYYRQSTKAGDGFVQLLELNRGDNGFGFMATWQVVIFVPQDVEAAEKWMENHLQTLIDALEDELIVTNAGPDTALLPSGATNTITITGAREA